MIIERAFPVDPASILPAVTPDSEPFWKGCAEGRLLLQACLACGRPRHPIAPACPYCRGNAWRWREMSGRGTVFSWVRYHKSYLPEFADLIPYVVATVELEEGPRLFGRLIGRDIQPAIGRPVALVIERWPDGRCVPAFALKETDA